MKALYNILSCFVLLLASGLHAQELADFSGLWMPDRGSGPIQGFPRENWPFTQYGQQLYDAYTADFDPDKDDAAFFCVPPGMPMSMAQIPPFAMEIIQRENDITIFYEAWSQYRKIYIEGYDYPEPILASRMGHSVGRWNSDELIVKGSFLSERTMGRSLMSEQANWTERLTVKMGEDGLRRLSVDMIFTDSIVYTQAIVLKGRWIESPQTPIMEYVCSEGLYQDHLERVRGTRKG